MEMNELIRSQQGELDGVGTYLKLAKTVHNSTDAETFRKLAADEGRHAAVFRKYTGAELRPKKTQADIVALFYRLFGKKILYPVMAKAEYSAIPGYEKMMSEYPEVEGVKNDEKRHGDTLMALLDNGEYNDRPMLPSILCGAALCTAVVLCIRKIYPYIRSRKQW